MPHVTCIAHCLEKASVFWGSVNNETNSIGRTMYLDGNVLAFIRGIMLKLR